MRQAAKAREGEEKREREARREARAEFSLGWLAGYTGLFASW